MIVGWFLSALVLPHIVFVTLPAEAATRIITATHTYVMGDRDSKEDARSLCYMTAKRKLLEEAGSFIQSSTEVRNFELTEDQITSYSAAVLKVQIVKEEVAFNNGVNTLTLTLKADVDGEEVRQHIEGIVGNKALQVKVDAQQQQIRKMEQQLQMLSEQLRVVSESSKEKLQKDRAAELAAYIRLRAETGEAAAQFALGIADYAELNYVQAASWFRKAAEQGDANAQVMLGSLYETGKGFPQDFAQAISWFRKAANQGHAQAQFFLGMLYERGDGVPQDHLQAAELIRKAAEQSHGVAQTILGGMCLHGRGVRQDAWEANRWYRKAAFSGIAEAQIIVGHMYQNGIGTLQSFASSYVWCHRAALSASEEKIKNEATNCRDKSASYLKPDEIAFARRVAENWEPASTTGHY